MKDWTPSDPSGTKSEVDKVIGFGVPMHESVEGVAFDALSMTWASWLDIAPADWKLKVRTLRSCIVTENRNRIASALLADGFDIGDRHVPGMDAPRSPVTTRAADVIIWNDADCAVAPEEYVRLAQTLLDSPPDVAAVGYAFPIQSGDDKPRPNAWPVGGGRLAFSAPGPVSLVEVEWIGFGVVATRADVYQRMSHNAAEAGEYGNVWFSHVGGNDGRGEDIGWCRAVRALGCHIMLDVGVLGAHCYRAPHTLQSYYATGHLEG